MNNSSTEYKLANCKLLYLEVDDEHYYYINGDYALSVTQVLDIGAPFPEGLRQYLRISSYEEQTNVLKMTGDRGKKLHHALEQLMNRVELKRDDYPTSYEKDAITMFIKFMTFLDPGKNSTELKVADPDLRVAGTLDFKGFVDAWKLQCLTDPLKYLEVDSDGHLQLKEKWLDLPTPGRVHVLIDWKFTGRNAYNHKVQVAAYKTMNNKSRPGRKVSRAFTWRYSPKHKFGFDFSESLLNYKSFTRVYDTTIEYLADAAKSKDPFEPPKIKRYPETFRLYEPINNKEKT